MSLWDKPLIVHVMDVVHDLVEEILLVVSSQSQAENIRRLIGPDFPVLIDDLNLQGPLAGASTGFEEAQGEYSLLAPCDTPLISRDVLQYLFELCEDMNAAIPRWPNGYIEPLQSVYHTDHASKFAQEALKEGRSDMRSMIGRMKRVRYISTLVLKKLNPELSTFLNVNTPSDLTKVESLLESVNPRRIS